MAVKRPLCYNPATQDVEEITDADTLPSALVPSGGGGGSSAWGGITGTLSNQTDLQNALNAKAPTANAALTGTPTSPTAAPGTNTTQISTTAFVAAAVAALVNSSPSALDTLNELATALGNDANFATTVNNAIALKEASANKATDFTVQNNTKFPTVQAVAVAFTKGGLTVVIDGSGSALTTGLKLSVSMPFGFTITGWTIVADQSGSIVVDVKKSNYASFPATASIAGTEKPTLASARTNRDLTLTSWTTAVAEDDILDIYLDSVAAVTRIALTIKFNRV